MKSSRLLLGKQAAYLNIFVHTSLYNPVTTHPFYLKHFCLNYIFSNVYNKNIFCNSGLFLTASGAWVQSKKEMHHAMKNKHEPVTFKILIQNPAVLRLPNTIRNWTFGLYWIYNYF